MSMSPRVVNALLFTMFLSLISYLYLFGTPDLQNFGQVALVIVGLRLLLYWLLPNRDLASSLSVAGYKKVVSEEVQDCGMKTDTHQQYKSCLQNTMDR
jgi:hypothetical protein